MSSKKNLSLLGMVLTLVLAISNCGCGGGAATPLPISVSLSNASATVVAGGTAQFTATVINDSANKGVTWAVSCSAPSCGSVSPTSTASGGATTYSAPAKPLASDLTVILTAKSVTDTMKTASAPITVPAITISISPPFANVAINTTQQVTGTVNNDPSNAGVTWTLTQNGAACSPGCGTVAPSSTASGAAVTYTAPATVPTPAAATLTATSVADTTNVASSTITVTPPPVGVSVLPSSATVEAGGTQSFTATVTNDPANQGVTWSVAIRHCRPILGGCYTSPCTTGCGTFSPANTSSGAPTTYTAPGKLASGAFVVATSVTNTKATGTGSLTFLPISVSVSPTSHNVALNAMQTFTATVTNDATNSEVTWSLTEIGVPCSPGCGTISPTNTASGATLTYTAPAAPTVLQSVTVSATSIEDPTASGTASVTLPSSGGAADCAGSGSESLLKGQYAFLIQGFDSQSLGVLDKQGGLAIGGSFRADGAGNVTGGEEDIVVGQGEFYSTFAAGSTYAVGPDHRGCLLLIDARGNLSLFHFALGATNASSVATAGHIVEFDHTTGTETRAAGILRLQDATSFAASQFKGTYTYGMVGVGVYTGRVAMAGTFNSDGVSAIPTSNFDIDGGGGALTTDASSTGSFTCCSVNGRGSLQVSTVNPSGNLPINSIFFYMINSSDAFLVVFSDVWSAGGEAIGISSGTNFSQASLSGAAVLRETAQSSSGPIVDIATVSSSGTGAMTTNDNINSAGTFGASSTALNYTVASNGRVTFTGATTPPVVYLYGPNQGFLVGTDPDVTFGILESQAAGPFSNAFFSGAYTFATENPSANTVTMESGVVTADGNGNAAGSVDQSTGLTQNQALNFTYSFPANGVGNVGSGTTAILISGNKLVFINNTSANPTSTVLEK